MKINQILIAMLSALGPALGMVGQAGACGARMHLAVNYPVSVDGGIVVAGAAGQIHGFSELVEQTTVACLSDDDDDPVPGPVPMPPPRL